MSFDWINSIPQSIARARQAAMAALLYRLDGRLHQTYGEHKQRWLQEVPLQLVEIGPGAGANFRYYPPGTHVVAIEPGDQFHAYLQDAARKRSLKLTLLREKGERLPLDDKCTSLVVCSLVLCSVEDPQQVITESRRVLQDGGRFVFLEHVAAAPESRLGRAQRMLRRPWKCLFDGCNLDRNTESAIRGAGFTQVFAEPFSLEPRWLPFAPHVAGIAIK